MHNGAKLLDQIKKDIPGFRIVEKNNSKFMKLLNFFVKRFNPHFMYFITTIGKTVYWPRKPKNFNATKNYITLWHEGVHAYDFKRLSPILFGILYTFPQCLFLLALLAILSIWFSHWWLLALIALAFLAPLPAPFRVLLELRAYQTGILVYKPKGYNMQKWVDARIKSTFCGADYYWMSWRKKRMRARLEKMVNKSDKLYPPWKSEQT